MLLEDFFPIKWWHPYCNSQFDGPGYWAYGVPLPYIEVTGVSSLESFFMPHAYVANIAILVLVLSPVTAQICRRLPGRRYAFLAVGALLAVALTSLQVWAVNDGMLRPVRDIANAKYDSYASYRPWLSAKVAGNKPCYM